MASFRTTVFLLIFGITLVSLFTLSFMSIKIINKKAEAMLEQDLYNYARIIKHEHGARLNEILNSGLALAKNPRLAKLITDYDEEAAEEILNELLTSGNLDMAMLLDSNGTVILRAKSNMTGDKTNIDIIYQVIENNWPTASTEIINEDELFRYGLTSFGMRRIPTLYQRPSEKEYETAAISLVSVIPIGDKYIFLADILNKDYAFPDKIKYLTDFESAVFMNDVIVSTTKTTQKGNRFIGTLMSEEAYNTTLIKNRLFYGKTWIINQPGRAIYLPMKNHRSKTIGAIAFWADETEFKKSEFLSIDLSREIIIISSAILLVSLVLSFFVSKRLTKPINEMIESAIKISQGDFEQGVKIESYDELNKLAATFNVMIRYIRKQIIEDERKIIKELKGKK